MLDEGKEGEKKDAATHEAATGTTTRTARTNLIF